MLEQQVKEFGHLPQEEQIKALASSVQTLGKMLEQFRGVMSQMQQYIQQNNWATGLILEALDKAAPMPQPNGTGGFSQDSILPKVEFDRRMAEIIDEANKQIEAARKQMLAKQAGLVLPGDPRYTPPPNVKST